MLPILYVSLCVADWWFAVARPNTRDQIWLAVLATDGYPTWLAGGGLIIGVATILLLGTEWHWRPAIVELALVVVFLVYGLSTRIAPMTGDQPAWLHYAGSPLTPSTEPLAAALYKTVHAATGGSVSALQLVPPLVGVVALICYLRLVRTLSRRWTMNAQLLRGFIFATPFPFWFVTGYIENTFIGLPTLLLAIDALLRWEERGRRTHQLVVAGALLGLTCLFHGQFLVLLPAVGMWVVLVLGLNRAALVQLAAAGSVLFAVAAAVVGLLVAVGLQIVTGAATGGYDGQMLTPLATRPGDTLSRFAMFSHAHLIQTANIVVQAAPTIVLSLPMLIAVMSIRKGRSRQLLSGMLPATDASLLGLLAGAYLVFVSLWGFDFGMVGDLDLMLTMGVPLSLLCLLVVQRLLGSRSAAMIVLIVSSAWAQVAFYSLKVATTWSS